MQSFVYLIAETQIWHWSAIPMSNIQSLFFRLCIHLSVSLSQHLSPPCVNLTLNRIIQICCSLRPTLHSCHHQLKIRWNQPAQPPIQNQCLVNNAVNNLVLLWKSFFFWISNIRILLIIEKVPSRVHWGCTNSYEKLKNQIIETFES